MKAHIGIDLQPVRTIAKVFEPILHKSFHTVVLKTPQQGRSLNSVTVVMLALQFDTRVTLGKLSWNPYRRHSLEQRPKATLVTVELALTTSGRIVNRSGGSGRTSGRQIGWMRST
uniref:(northern house mosquito) hypothetical protein n=1 Tax=Culex pipiens TaxID=7175 RepID=A0A8D8CAQ1_CULPI